MPAARNEERKRGRDMGGGTRRLVNFLFGRFFSLGVMAGDGFLQFFDVDLVFDGKRLEFGQEGFALHHESDLPVFNDDGSGVFLLFFAFRRPVGEEAGDDHFAFAIFPCAFLGDGDFGDDDGGFFVGIGGFDADRAGIEAPAGIETATGDFFVELGVDGERSGEGEGEGESEGRGDDFHGNASFHDKASIDGTFRKQGLGPAGDSRVLIWNPL